MKLQFVVLTFVTLSLMGAAFALAHDCSHDGTVQALRECVEHAAAEGHIDNPGITRSLLAKLDAAEAAIDRGQSSAAINKLEAFIREVEAQAGKHIVAEHAQHLVEHAELVIQALGG